MDGKWTVVRNVFGLVSFPACPSARSKQATPPLPRRFHITWTLFMEPSGGSGALLASRWASLSEHSECSPLSMFSREGVLLFRLLSTHAQVAAWPCFLSAHVCHLQACHVLRSSANKNRTPFPHGLHHVSLEKQHQSLTSRRSHYSQTTPDRILRFKTSTGPPRVHGSH